MNEKLFEYAVIFHPTKKEREEQGKRSVMVVKPTFVLAKSDQEVVLLACRSLSSEYMENADRLEVAVRPF